MIREIASAIEDEPSDRDVANALKNKLTSELSLNPFAGAFVEGLADATKFKIKSIKKLSCKPDGSNAHICDVEVISTNNITGEDTTIEKFRFVKGSKGWAVTD